MSQRHCPMCKAVFDSEQSPALPFCSMRCRLADLNRWFREGYGLPDIAEEEEEEFQEPSEEGETEH
jgi:endogenous inhibitor of DNA gyrase (YacG/DUF329 family)